jgi:hypothetical protein
MANTESNLTLEIYKGYALNEFDRWDAVLHPEVQANSPARRGVVGLEPLKWWNRAFIAAFRPRTDLIDHFVAGDRGR